MSARPGSGGVVPGELGRFLLVGLLAYGTDVAVFNLLLLGAGTHPVAAKVVSSAAAVAVAFVGSRWWTWRSRPRGSLRRESLLFLGVSVVAAAVQVGCLLVSRHVLGLHDPVSDNVAANVVGMALATALRFWGFRTVVFRGPDRRRRPAGDARPATVTAAGGGTPGRAGTAARS